MDTDASAGGKYTKPMNCTGGAIGGHASVDAEMRGSGRGKLMAQTRQQEDLAFLHAR